MEMAVMGRKKPGPKPAEGGVKSVPTTLRSTEAWKGWLERLATFDAEGRRSNGNISETIDRALVAYAREIGFKEAAPRR